MWQDGKKVIEGQVISLELAEKLLEWEVGNKTAAINGMLQKTILNQCQFDALCSFAFNVGIGGLQGSTLLKLVRFNPSNASIHTEFLRWNKARVAGKLTIIKGLSDRRLLEANYYFNL
jgi:lysozyme